jgi:hypothetical protein
MVPTIGHGLGKEVNESLKIVDLTDTQSVGHFDRDVSNPSV